MKFLLFLASHVLVLCAHAQSTVLIPPAPSLPPRAEPANAAQALEQTHQQLKEFGELIAIGKEGQKAEHALKQELAKLKPGETKSFVVVTKDKPIGAGGEFVGIEEVLPSGSPGMRVGTPAGTLRVVSKPYPVTGYTPLDIRSEEQKKREDAEMVKKANALKEAEAAEKRLREEKAAADKKQQEAEARKKEAEAAAAKAKAAAAEAARKERAAQQAERAAQRDGERLQRQINREIARYKAAGGPFRAPAGGSH